jgi:hypothetical protein
VSTDEQPQLDLGEEVSRLTEAFQGWWSRSLPDEDEDEHAPHDAASCRICPLCRAMDVVRAVSPDVLERVATAAETVAVLLREAASGQGGTSPEPADDATTGAQEERGGRDAWA